MMDFGLYTDLTSLIALSENIFILLKLQQKLRGRE
jgi:hypothetical protein